jgi:putative ABC transport system substrate-binding protein
MADSSELLGRRRFPLSRGIRMRVHMGRREFITLLGSAAIACPRAPRAQSRMRKIGILFGLAEGDPEGDVRIGVFQHRLQELGWAEGKTVSITPRWSAGDADQIRANAADLVGLAPDTILVTNTPTLRAVREKTRIIPIVFVNVADPVAVGAVEHLARPGANATGFTLFETTIGSKWLELLKEVQPTTRQVAAIFNPETGVPLQYLRSLETAAPSFGVEVVPSPIRDKAEIERTIPGHADVPSLGLVVLPDPFAVVHRDLIARLINQVGKVSVYPFRQYAKSGGLMCYGVDLNDQYRQAASYIDRILRGADPRDLPVQAPNKFELIINLKTAAALRIAFPPILLVRADEVIE